MREKKRELSPGGATLIEGDPPLSPHRAFVVQFRAGAGEEPGRFAGRVEHMVSGQAARFQSLEELVAFITQVLTNVHP
ncbi:MAG TPA: hypothetical protein VGX03_24245 [Candidatus Binatia bacterium]|nr:hypothetical protein [Candidatus Binatia bacterium]